MIENLSDKEIIQALRRYDERVTREFFYDICLMAYSIDDKKYGLRYKTGMDFYSLAHEYYLRLCTHDWQQLEKCKTGFTLARWTMNGFHYLVRERLKSYASGFLEESIEERAARGKVDFDAPVDNTDSEVKEMVEDICHAYFRFDRTSQSILRMILVMGMKGKEVAAVMGITPSAVSQRYRSMFDNVVRPYFIKYYRHEPSYSMEESAVPTYMSCESKGRMSISGIRNEERKREPKERSLRSVGGETRKRKSLMDKIKFWRHDDSTSADNNRITSPAAGNNHIKPSAADNNHITPSASVNNRITPSAVDNNRITPSAVKALRKNEVFVFGSDLRGIHCGGTAYQALRSFGAVLGKGVGPQGQCYAIPTIVGGLHNIKPYIDDFIKYASSHPHQTFLVTRVGCGIAGFSPKDIAPLFAEARNVSNICLPQEFWDNLERL